MILGDKMDKLEPNSDKKVKAITLGDDCIYIDLMDGLRLSGPLAPRQEQAAAPEHRPRRMIVSGHEAVYDKALAIA
jgi:hypothetical protein